LAAACDPAETRAIAIAGMSFTYALVGMLKRTGVLDPNAIESTFDAALSGLEHATSPTDRAAALARQLLELMERQLAAHLKPLTAPPEPSEKRKPGAPRTDRSVFARR
jgi:hypothetical protein